MPEAGTDLRSQPPSGPCILGRIGENLRPTATTQTAARPMANASALESSRPLARPVWRRRAEVRLGRRQIFRRPGIKPKKSDEEPSESTAQSRGFAGKMTGLSAAAADVLDPDSRARCRAIHRRLDTANAGFTPHPAINSEYAQSTRTDRLQKLCRPHAVRVSARHHGRCRAQRLGQIERRRCHQVGAGRAERQKPARQGDGRRHLQRLRQPQGAEHRRNDAHVRQFRSPPGARYAGSARHAPGLSQRRRRSISSIASRAGCAIFAICSPAPASPPKPTASSSRAKSM